MPRSNLHYFSLYCILFILLSSSCEKDEAHPIPSTYVNFNINLLTDPEFLSLTAQGNAMAITGSMLGYNSSRFLGYDNNGITVYNAGGGEYYAFDQTCPYDFPKSIRITSNNTGGTGTCPECHSVYVYPSEGTPTYDGPATLPLKTYKTVYNPNTGELNVFGH